MGDSEKFSNNSPDLQDALRSIEATGEDSGANSGEGAAPEGEPHSESGASGTSASGTATELPFDAEHNTDSIQ